MKSGKGDVNESPVDEKSVPDLGALRLSSPPSRQQDWQGFKGGRQNCALLKPMRSWLKDVKMRRCFNILNVVGREVQEHLHVVGWGCGEKHPSMRSFSFQRCFRKAAMPLL